MVRLKDDVNHTSARAEETLMPSETSAILHSLLRAICCLCIRPGIARRKVRGNRFWITVNLGNVTDGLQLARFLVIDGDLKLVNGL